MVITVTLQVLLLDRGQSLSTSPFPFLRAREQDLVTIGLRDGEGSFDVSIHDSGSGGDSLSDVEGVVCGRGMR